MRSLKAAMWPRVILHAATHCGEFDSGLRSAVSVYFDDFFRRQCCRELGSDFSFDFGLFFGSVLAVRLISRDCSFPGMDL